jgi:signal transduction histidine kinase
VIITVRYRDGLEQRLRTDLTSGASALRAARTPAAFKSVIGSLAAEGISVDLAGITAKGGTLQTTPGEALLTVHEQIPVDGNKLPASLTGSLAGIDRQVRSLEVTEAIGGAIALALLAALARVLVLLDRAVSEARASEAAMRTFLADASHELRTPVAALHATAERLLRDQPARPERDAIEAQLARDSGRLGRLIEQTRLGRNPPTSRCGRERACRSADPVPASKRPRALSLSSSSTACAWRSWRGAKRLRRPASIRDAMELEPSSPPLRMIAIRFATPPRVQHGG